MFCFNVAKIGKKLECRKKWGDFFWKIIGCRFYVCQINLLEFNTYF